MNDELDKKCLNNKEYIILLNECKSIISKFDFFECLFHICCFSSNRDSLEQWAMYADDAKGIAIGINEISLRNFAICNENMNFEKVCYDDSELRNTISQSIDEMLDKYNNTSNTEDDVLLNFAYMVLNNVLKKAYFYKDSHFKNENEYRLVYNSKPINPKQEINGITFFNQEIENNEVKLNSLNDILTKIDFYVSNGKLISYRALKPYWFCQQINEIIIGPKSNVSCEDIQLLLQTHNMYKSNINIAKSAIPYQ